MAKCDHLVLKPRVSLGIGYVAVSDGNLKRRKVNVHENYSEYTLVVQADVRE